MATSSNQPDENMSVGTSKPDDDALPPSRTSSMRRELLEQGNSSGKDEDDDALPPSRTSSMRRELVEQGNSSGKDDDDALPPSRTSSMRRELVEQGNSSGKDEDDDALPPSRTSSMRHELVEQGNSSRKDEDNDALPPSRTSSMRHELVEQGNSSGKDETNECSKYLPLYKAALRGDWATAERIFDQDPGALTAPITEFSRTALHVAAELGRNTNDFVKKLADKMPPESINEAYGIALTMSAFVGNTEAVKVLLQKNPSLVYFREDNKMTAFIRAALNGKKDTLRYLLEVTANDPSSKLFPDEDSAAYLIKEIIANRYYDIALYLIKKYPLLAVSKRDNGDYGLNMLAEEVSAFKSGTHYQWWQRIIYAHVPVKLNQFTISHSRGCDIENPVDHPDQVKGRKYKWAARLLVEYFCISVPCIEHIQKQKEMHVQALELLKCLCGEIASLKDTAKCRLLTQNATLFAARNGIPEIVQEILESFPDLLWTMESGSQRQVFDVAVVERQENVFNLIYQMGQRTREIVVSMFDGFDNNMLHLSGQLSPPTKLSQVSGAAMQMQHELQWFEAVKKLMNPVDIEWKNTNGKTPAMVFTEEHKKLVAEGEKWMKDTANSCTIPAALIVTMVFAAAITIPGGINGTNGVPIFYKEMVFNIFVVSDAISLFTSTTSLLVFLSILTSRYAERDFLFALPNRLIIGLFTLFLSITAMLIAFSCALYLLFGNKNREWIIYPVAALACVPIISFASLQYPLLRDLMKSTYGPGIFGIQSEVPFYN